MFRRFVYAALLIVTLTALVVAGRYWPGTQASEVPDSTPAESPTEPPPAGSAPASTTTAAASTAAPVAPEFPAAAEWVQGGPLRLADLRGKVTVVHFWTNGCINCIHNYPVYRAWQRKYADKKVTLIGVHTPEFDWEAPAQRVRSKARDNGLTFPIVLDRNYKIWRSWGNRYWPAIYLVDQHGKVRYNWEGELHLDTADGKQFAAHIDELLAER